MKTLGQKKNAYHLTLTLCILLITGYYSATRISTSRGVPNLVPVVYINPK